MPEIVSFWRLDASEIDGRFMRAGDVIEWRDSIRAAVEAERDNAAGAWAGPASQQRYTNARAALDALLKGGA